MQSSHHEISFLQFSKFFGKTPNISEYLILVNHNTKSQERIQKLFSFLFDISTMKISVFSLHFLFRLFQRLRKIPNVNHRGILSYHDLELEQIPPESDTVEEIIFSTT